MQNSKGMTVTIISEKKALDVTPRSYVGLGDEVLVDVCTSCSALVFDPVAHDIWHRGGN